MIPFLVTVFFMVVFGLPLIMGAIWAAGYDIIVSQWFRDIRRGKYCVVCEGEQLASWIPWWWSSYGDEQAVVDHPNICKKHIEQVQRIANLEHDIWMIRRYD